jgi:hypothetical protein
MKKLALALGTLTAMLFCTHGLAAPGLGNPGIANIDSRITTPKSYADLGAEWWQWALQAPAANSPLLDISGEYCSVGQQGPVWFLAGTLGGGAPVVRTCQVPNGKAIFFPVINAAYFAFPSDPPDERTAESVRSTAQGLCDRNSIRDVSVTIDGVEVSSPVEYYTSAEQSPIFQVQLPTDNPFISGTPLMLSPSAHQGFYIYVKPLEPGQHTVEWTATWDCDFDADGEFESTSSETIFYYLTVLTGVANEVQ